MEEVWKDVPNYEGRYEISNHGKLKSFAYGKVKILKGSKNNDGYLQYTLNFKEKKLINTFGAHQLVAICFLNHEPKSTNGLVVDHIDDDITNNHITNLRLISNRDNSIKRFEIKRKFGVSKYYKRFKANIWHNGKHLYLGTYDDEHTAHLIVVDYIKKHNLKRLL